MLVLKKISTKKLVISLSIIFFMICGTGFILYQNKKLTASQSTNVNIPIVFDNPAPAALGAANNQAAAEPSQVLDTDKISQNGGFNLTIFSSNKFKMLEEGASAVKEQPGMGKRDPFKPN